MRERAQWIIVVTVPLIGLFVVVSLVRSIEAAGVVTGFVGTVAGVVGLVVSYVGGPSSPSPGGRTTLRSVIQLKRRQWAVLATAVLVVCVVAAFGLREPPAIVPEAAPPSGGPATTPPPSPMPSPMPSPTPTPTATADSTVDPSEGVPDPPRTTPPQTRSPRPSATTGSPSLYVLGMGVSAQPRTATVPCGPGDTITFTFEISARGSGTVMFTWIPDDRLALPRRAGSITFTGTQTKHAEYVIPREASPGTRIQGQMTVEVTAPAQASGVVGDIVDITCQ